MHEKRKEKNLMIKVILIRLIDIFLFILPVIMDAKYELKLFYILYNYFVEIIVSFGQPIKNSTLGISNILLV